MLFFIIVVPLNLGLLGLFAWYTAAGSPRRFLASFVATGAASALAVTLALWHFQSIVSPPPLLLCVLSCLPAGCARRPAAHGQCS